MNDCDFPKQRNPLRPKTEVPRCSPLFEIAFVLVRLEHIASFIRNANHGIMWAAVVHCVSHCETPHVLHNFHDYGKAPAPDGNSHPLIRRDAWEFLPAHPQTGRISSIYLSDFSVELSPSPVAIYPDQTEYLLLRVGTSR